MALKQIKKWYVDNANLDDEEVRRRDRWCLQAFGEWRHDNEIDEGWWLQDDAEYTLFVLTWG